MTRKVVDNHQVAHLWANQSQAEARSHNGNFHFSGTRIYSYRTVIANIVKAPNGEPVVLRTSETFSITTSGKHESAIHSALGYRNANRDDHGRRVFFVPNVGDYYGDINHEKNLAFYVAKALELTAKVMTTPFSSWKANDVTSEDHGEGEFPFGITGALPRFLAMAAHTFAMAREYAETFGLPVAFDGANEITSALGQWREREARFNDPKQVAKREREAARRAARKEAEERAKIEAERAANLEWFVRWQADPNNVSRPYAHAFETGSAEHAAILEAEAIVRANHARDALEALDAYLKGGPELHYRQVNALNADHRAEWQGESNRRRHAKETAEREAWLAGQPGARFHGLDSQGMAYIRAIDVTRDSEGNVTGGTLQTSQGATVPLAEALRAFRFLKLVRARGEAWAANGQRIRVGGFQVNRIEANGDFQAGCHRIAYAECVRLAMRLGVADIAPDDSAVISRGMNEVERVQDRADMLAAYR
jgi:hypothetical protein